VLADLLEKAGDGDFLRAVAEAVLQLLMECDVEGLIGAGRYERSGKRTTWRNGYRDRPRHPAWRAAIADPEAAARLLFPAVSRSPQELGEGADRGDPGGLDRRRVDPAS
jgi:Transposase, Mutator family